MEVITVKDEAEICKLHRSDSRQGKFNHKENDNREVNANIIIQENIFEQISNQPTLSGGFRFACDCCDNIFDNFIKLFKHRQNNNFDDSDKIEDKNFQTLCFYCPLQFDSIIFHDGYVTIQKEKPRLQSSCDFCQKNFKTKTYFPHNCQICNISSVSTCQQLASHLKKVHKSEKQFRCVLCGSGFNWIELLKTHIRKHTGERPYECNICNKKFSNSSYLRRHKQIHTGEKPYVCNYCDRKYTSAQKLKAHKSIHTNPSTCQTCGKTYATPYTLKNHLYNTHNNSIPFRKEQFQCELCPRTFCTKSSLKYHSYRHTGDKIFKCNECQRQFLTPYSLKNHMQIHTSNKIYDCQLCSKIFLSKTKLKRHIRYHRDTIEKRFKCEQCSKAYRSKFELDAHHKSIHENRLKCDQCPETYMTKEDLEYHKCTHTRKSNEKINICDKYPEAYSENHPKDERLKCDSYNQKHGLEYHKKMHIEEAI